MSNIGFCENIAYMSTAPIALFVYNRPEHTRKTVEALQKNLLAKESDIFIFSDGPKGKEMIDKIYEVRKYLKTITGFRLINIIERKENLGLANSIIGGVTEIINKFGKVVVLEDDLVTSPYFLEYMNEGLDLYKDDQKVSSIHGYIYPVKKHLPETFFLRGADCWGWATWKRVWDLFEPDGKKLLKELEKQNLIEKFNMDGSFNYSGMLERQIEGKNNSWAIRWHAEMFILNKLTLYPGISLVQNIGQDESGTHKGNSTRQEVTLSERKIKIKNVPLKEDVKARKIIIQHLQSLKPKLFQKILKKILS